MKTNIHALCLIWIVFQVSGCSDESMSPDEEIRQFVKSGVAAAENRSLGDLLELIDNGYLDQNGYKKKQMTGLLRIYFARHSNIHLFTRVIRVELLGKNQAEVQLHVAMAGSVISDVDALSALHAQFYRFNLQLVKQEKWLLRSASWAPASIDVFE